MKKQGKHFNGRLGIVVGLVLLIMLSVILQTTGGSAQYRTQVVVSGTIMLENTVADQETIPTQTDSTEPDTTEPLTAESEETEPEIEQDESGDAESQP